jgi:hybrid cluster-associated redox disulfide protein
MVTKEMTIGELLRLNENVIPVLMGIGMHCIGCPASLGESIEEACYVHGIDPDELVERLNEVVGEKSAEA